MDKKLFFISFILSLLYILLGTYISSFGHTEIELEIMKFFCENNGNPSCELIVLFFTMPSYSLSRIISMFAGGSEIVFYIVQFIMLIIYAFFIYAISLVILKLTSFLK